MALIDVECVNDACAHVTLNHFRRAADWEMLPPCEQCGGPTQRIFLPPRVTWDVAPVVVYQAPDGSFRYPGATESASTRNYEQLGYSRVELKGFAAVRQFERQVNRQESSAAAARAEREHAGRSLRESSSRSELFHQMKSMSNLGRAVAHAAIAQGNARPQPRAHEPGFRVEVYSDDRSSRDASRGADGRRRRD